MPLPEISSNSEFETTDWRQPVPNQRPVPPKFLKLQFEKTSRSLHIAVTAAGITFHPYELFLGSKKVACKPQYPEAGIFHLAY